MLIYGLECNIGCLFLNVVKLYFFGVDEIVFIEVFVMMLDILFWFLWENFNFLKCLVFFFKNFEKYLFVFEFDVLFFWFWIFFFFVIKFLEILNFCRFKVFWLCKEVLFFIGVRICFIVKLFFLLLWVGVCFEFFNELLV